MITILPRFLAKFLHQERYVSSRGVGTLHIWDTQPLFLIHLILWETARDRARNFSKNPNKGIIGHLDVY
jgi:hypothetical protein